MLPPASLAALTARAASAARNRSVLSRFLLNATADSADLRSAFVANASGMYAIMVASLLTIFVQQSCASESDPNVAHSCSFYEKVSAGRSSNRLFWARLVLGWNFITLAALLTTTAVLFWRENFLIGAFDRVSYQAANFLNGETKAGKDGRPEYYVGPPSKNKQEQGGGSFIKAVVEKLQRTGVGSALLSCFLSTERTDDELSKYVRIKHALNAHNRRAFLMAALALGFIAVKCVVASACVASRARMRQRATDCDTPARPAASSSRAFCCSILSFGATAAQSPSSRSSATRR